MMSIYAIVNVPTGLVESMTLWDGESEWSPPDGYIAVLGDDVPGLGAGWSYADGVFTAPPIIPPAPEEILLNNQNMQAQLLSMASQSMTPVLLSLQLGEATDTETMVAKEWQMYYRALQAVDLSVASPGWPTAPAQ
jgi:hypothetical protein